MLFVPAASHLPQFYTVAAWLCSACGFYLIATMIPARWGRLARAVAKAFLIGAYLIVWLPDCDSADWWTWFAMGCAFLS